VSDRISTSEWRKASAAGKERLIQRRVEHEHFEQVALFDWAKRLAGRMPELALLFAIPNGGKRSKAVAGKLKAEGVKAGVPDICLPVPRGSYHGLFIELKAKGGAASDSQRNWLRVLGSQNYCTRLCVGWEEARETIESYLRQAEVK
jgi:hypothetical protein